MDCVDAHLHVVDPRHPLVPNDGYLPPPFTVADYRAAVDSLQAEAGLTVTGGVVVSGSFQGFDTGYVVDALTELGDGFCGVVNLPRHASDDDIHDLDGAGVRAVRCNLVRGGSVDLAGVERQARRVHDLAGWHTEFYLDAADLPELAQLLRSLPQVSIDHFGMRDAPHDLLVDLAAGGAVVKATGLGRIEVSDPGDLLRRLLDVAPHGVVFGTDLPSTRARTPFSPRDATRLADWAGTHAPDVFAHNARRLYRLPR